MEQDEWSGEQKLSYIDIPEDIEPEEIRPMGNYAVSILWPDGFSQVLFIPLIIFATKFKKKKRKEREIKKKINKGMNQDETLGSY